MAVSQIKALGFLFAEALPALVSSFLRACGTFVMPSEAAAVERLYRELPSADLSRDVLAARPEALAVLRVAGVGWDDIGHPAGAIEARKRAAGGSGGPQGSPPRFSPFSGLPPAAPDSGPRIIA